MARWLMKTADDEYVEWSTETDAPTSEFMTRSDAVDEFGEERVGWADESLCSCRARLGERFEIRNGRAVAVGGGALAYQFESYDRVRAFMLNDGHNQAGPEVDGRLTAATTWEGIRAR
jgi:hypothetical protein